MKLLKFFWPAGVIIPQMEEAHKRAEACGGLEDWRKKNLHKAAIYSLAAAGLLLAEVILMTVDALFFNGEIILKRF